MRRAALLISLCCVALLPFASSAGAANSIFWSNSGGGSLGRVALDGSEGSVLIPSPVLAEEPFGSAIDVQTGKIFWGDFDSNTIKYGNLDGSGSAVLPTAGADLDGPNAPVVDLADGRIYWANALDDTISWANLDGSGGGNIDTGAAPVEEPWGVAIAPTANRIYWANFAGNSIAYANLDGSGGGGRVPLSANFAEEPDSVAVAGNDKVYWTNFEGGSGGGSIGWASLGLPEAGLVPLPAGLVVEPGGLAISGGSQLRDRIYWTNEGGSEGVFSAWAEGQEAVRIDTNGPTLAQPSSPSLFEAPNTTALIRPRAVRVSVGATLTCKPANWAADSVESHLYRAPQSSAITWTLEGSPLNGATGESLTATQPGTYACQVTATNGAGSTTVTTATYQVRPARGPSQPSRSATVHLTKIKHDVHDGTVTITATVTGSGTLTLSGRKIVGRSIIAAGAGVQELKVAAKGRFLRILKRTGKLRAKALIEFVATSGARTAPSRLITLRRRLKR